MRVAWLTDIHLELVEPPRFEDLASEVSSAAPDAVLIGGDIATGLTLDVKLEALYDRIEAPIFFVLGNHDYYRTSVERARASAREAANRFDRLSWLGATGAVSLSDNTAIVGAGGWGDTRFGDFDASDVLLNDFLLISNLAGLERTALRQRLCKLGDECALRLESGIRAASQNHDHVVVLTHVPPFQRACLHEGQIAPPAWLPFFAWKAGGDCIKEAARENPDVRYTVLCGHTHCAAEVRIAENVLVYAGEAQYGKPHLQRVFEFD